MNTKFFRVSYITVNKTKVLERQNEHSVFIVLFCYSLSVNHSINKNSVQTCT